MESTKDKVFDEVVNKPADFKFNNTVAGVFDDMVNRSVPYYEEMQRMISELAAAHVIENTSVYDLGCSTGTTMIKMNPVIPEGITFIGVDDSPEMLEKCRQKLKAAGFSRNVQLQVADLNNGIKITNASVVVLCLTLQFVRPINRDKLLKTIFDGLVPGGVVIILE